MLIKIRWSLVVVLVGCLSVLTLISFASPPDPGWLGGIWDAADFDDVIMMLVAYCEAGSSAAQQVDAMFLRTVVGLIAAAREDPPLTVLASCHSIRAPPAA